MKYEVMLNNKKYEIEVDECAVAITGVSEVAMPVAAPVAPIPPITCPFSTTSPTFTERQFGHKCAYIV